MPSNKIKRKATARVLHVACNAMESLRIMSINESMRKGASVTGLTREECVFLARRTAEIKKQVDAVRKLAWRLER